MDFYRLQTEKEKHKKELFSKIIFFGAVILAVIAIFGAVYTVCYSGVFKIKKINISGLQGISPDELTANLENFFTKNSAVASFLGANNILVWQTEPDGFLKQYPQLESLDIEKDYFGREVTVSAKEREKFGIWCIQTRKNAEPSTDTTQNNAENDIEQCYWFDKTGIIFGEAPTIETEILNRVNDSSGKNINIGDTVLPQEFMPNLTSIFDILDKENLNTKTVYLDDLALQEVYTKAVSGDPKIYFSLNFDPRFSLAAINSLKDSGEWGKIGYVDFRVQNRAYYK